MRFLVRLAQVHEDFRRAELDAVAILAGAELDVISYSKEVHHSKHAFQSWYEFSASDADH